MSSSGGPPENDQNETDDTSLSADPQADQNYSPGPGDPNYVPPELNYTPAIQGVTPDALQCQSPETQTSSNPQPLNSAPVLPGDTPNSQNLAPADQDGRAGNDRPSPPASTENAEPASPNASYSEVTPLQVVNPSPGQNPAPDAGAPPVPDGGRQTPADAGASVPNTVGPVWPAPDLSFNLPPLTFAPGVNFDDVQKQPTEDPPDQPGPIPAVDPITVQDARSTTPDAGSANAGVPGQGSHDFGWADAGIPGAYNRIAGGLDAGTPGSASPETITPDAGGWRALPGDDPESHGRRRKTPGALLTSGRDLAQEERDRYGQHALKNARKGLDPSGRPVKQYTVPPPGLDERVASGVLNAAGLLLSMAPLIGAALESMGLLVFRDAAAAEDALETANALRADDLLGHNDQLRTLTAFDKEGNPIENPDDFAHLSVNLRPGEQTLLTHGYPGYVQVGNEMVPVSDLKPLIENVDFDTIRIYGCNVAGSEDAEVALQELADSTNKTIVAYDMPTTMNPATGEVVADYRHISNSLGTGPAKEFVFTPR